MIVSRKDKYGEWETLEGYHSRLSGPSYKYYYTFNNSWHRLYGRSWEVGWWWVNAENFTKFKPSYKKPPKKSLTRRLWGAIVMLVGRIFN